MWFFKYLFSKKYRERYYNNLIANITNTECSLEEDDKLYIEMNIPHKDIVVNKEHTS
ncbi:hypothetical protein CSC2_32350 [Clostridium zeae]|uniref:Uncharacterized protein n=1 Tax=Clostridium zeae TaxID=2759022 RepID=A0ABQ1ED85_9CLOT|nr:hypothetical protein [Clostridium zeae]GFZ32709.1 hypothetical protein CSC2_32350 [Clostridium zeae]